jgi:hypothetical protein
MKQLTTFLLILFPLFLNAQRITKDISTTKAGLLSCKYTYVAEPDKDTVYYVYCGFQNKKYTTITDIGSVYIANQEELDKLIGNLEKALGFMETKTNVSFEEPRYKLTIYDWAHKSLYVRDEDEKYTTLGKGQVIKWLEWLKSLQIPE